MFKFLILFLLVFINSSFADVYFNVPDGIELEEMNKNMPKMLNRYNTVQQIENQYKGKLKYKPSDNLFKYDRKGRYFSSVFFMINNNSFKTAEDLDNIGTKYNFNKNGFGNTFSAELGRYFLDSLFLSIEYFEYNGGDKLAFSYKSGGYTYDLSLSHKSRNYFFNIGLENNYSKIIPVFGAGIGIVANDLEKINSGFIVGLIDNTTIESKMLPAYQFFGGLDIVVGDNSFLVLRYKYFNTIGDFEIDVKDGYSTLRYKLELEKNNSSIMIGFKYLW